MNYKPFDLAAAKAGAPVITRDGERARIICFDADQQQPMIVLITTKDNGENIESYHSDGRYLLFSDSPNNYDLFMAPVKKTYYTNIFITPSGHVFASDGYSSEDNAIRHGNTKNNGLQAYIKTISFEVE